MSQIKRTVVVTGATSGIGFAVCDLLLQSGFRVFAVGRCEENCDKAQSQLAAKHPGAELRFFCGDLVHQHEVLRVAGEIKHALEESCCGALFGLVNNAGCVRSWYMTSDEGYEQQFALNHLAGFLLARELMPQLIKAGGRVLFTASQSHKHTRMRWNDLMLQRGYHPLFAYKQSKLCNLLTALALNERYGGDGVRACCVDPGLVDTGIGCKRTGWLVNFVWSARRRHGRPPELAATTYAYLLNCMEPPQELYFRDCRPEGYSREVSAKNAERLYQISLKLSGAKEGEELL